MPAALPLQSDISQASAGSTEFKVLTAKYGNGYEQRVADGLNNGLASWELSWENLTDADSTTIVAAFEAAKGVDYFTWQPPKSAVSKKWVISSYSITAMSGNIYTITASLRQVADLTV